MRFFISAFSALAMLSLLSIQAKAQSIETVAKADKSVVRIITLSETGTGTGTGYVVNDRGHVVTNHHVIRGAKYIYVLVRRPQGNDALQARLLQFNEDRDMAVLQVPELGGSPISFSDEPAVQGLKVFALGFPGVADMAQPRSPQDFVDILRNDTNFTRSTHTVGDVSRLIEESWPNSRVEIDIIQHTAAIRQGNSGGPLMDICGRVVGMNTAYLSDGDGEVYLASAAKEVIWFLDNANIPISQGSGDCGPATEGQQRWLLMGLILAAMLALILALSLLYLRRHNRSAAFAHARDDLSRRIRRLESQSSAEVSEPSARVPIDPLPPDPSRPSTTIVWRLKFHAPSGKTGFRFAQADTAKGLIIGRDPKGAGLCLSAPGISRRHSKLREEGGLLTIEDLNSTNGTFVNGSKLAPGQRAHLRSGDVILLGQIKGELEKE